MTFSVAVWHECFDTVVLRIKEIELEIYYWIPHLFFRVTHYWLKPCTALTFAPLSQGNKFVELPRTQTLAWDCNAWWNSRPQKLRKFLSVIGEKLTGEMEGRQIELTGGFWMLTKYLTLFQDSAISFSAFLYIDLERQCNSCIIYFPLQVTRSLTPTGHGQHHWGLSLAV